MSIPRKHHYVPKSYLAAWTDDGTVNGKLEVLDKSNGKSFRVKPVNVAKETDLYMIDVSEAYAEVKATEIESTFSTIEDAAAPVFKRIIDGQPMPCGEDRENIMAFLAVLTLRVPSHLRRIDDLMRKPVEAVLRRLMAGGKLPYPIDSALAANMKEWFDHGLILTCLTFLYQFK